MSASIGDVAREAGVSVATVSRALRGLPNVAPTTRERVEAAAARLHYVADPHAARLATRRSATVGVVVPALGRWYYAQLFAAIEAVLDAAGYDVLPYTVADRDARTRFLTTLPFRKRVDALIVVDTSFADPAWARVREAVGTVVTVGAPHADGVALTIDDAGAARDATEHLLALGHVRVGVLAGDDGVGGSGGAPARVRGYRDALAARSLPYRPELVVSCPPGVAGGHAAMARLLALPEPPTAVFATSDETAIGGLWAAREAGRSVPRDLSVVGFDDHDVAAPLDLTTVRQDVQQQGEAAARAVLERLGDREGTVPAPRLIGLPARLVVRGSTGPPPRPST